MNPCKASLTYNTLLVWFMFLSHKLQVHLNFFFFPINFNTANHTASFQYLSILLISMLASSRITLESLMIFVIISVASTNREPFRALNATDGFKKHSKINLSFSKGFSKRLFQSYPFYVTGYVKKFYNGNIQLQQSLKL